MADNIQCLQILVWTLKKKYHFINNTNVLSGYYSSLQVVLLGTQSYYKKGAEAKLIIFWTIHLIFSAFWIFKIVKIKVTFCDIAISCNAMQHSIFMQM